MKISDIKINFRIFMAVGVPAIGMLIFACYVIITDYKELQEASKMQEVMRVLPASSSFIAEMQKERGLTAGYLASDDKAAIENKLEKQRQDTDKELANLKKELENFDLQRFEEKGLALAEAIKAGERANDKLSSVRDDVTDMKIETSEAIGYYSDTIEEWLLAVAQVASLSTDPVIAAGLGAYNTLAMAKENAGQERAVVMGGLSAGRFDKKTFNKFVHLVSKQDAMIEVFLDLSISNQKMVNFYHDTMKDKAIDKVLKIREYVLASDIDAGFNGRYSPLEWFEASTARIDLLRKVELNLDHDIYGKVNDLYGGALNLLILVLIVSGTFILFAGTLGMIMVNSITKPISETVEGLKKLADNDLSINIIGADRKDEIGDIAKTMLVFKENAKERERLSQQQEAENKVKIVRAEKIGDLISIFDKQITENLGNLSSASTEMEATSKSMAGLADQTNEKSSMVASAATQASANVQNVASATEELTASIQELAQQVSRTSKDATSATRSINATKETVQRLSEAANRISNVVGLITDIAEQTNLLALNATIEAARAGDAGKGFAVVASEVKGLAGQTRKATDEISEMIKNVQLETESAVTAIAGVSDIIDTLANTTAAVASAIEEQNSATQEIARNVQEASKGTMDVTKNITMVNQAASESGQAAGEVLGVAGQLSQRSNVMKKEVETFLREIRAA